MQIIETTAALRDACETLARSEYLTIDTEFALAWLPLPESAERFLRWEWRWT